MRKLIVHFLGILLFIFKCGDLPTVPDIPAPTTTTIDPLYPPIEPPRVDEDFSWERYQGFTAFALQPEDVPSLFTAAMAHGWNTARVCSEVEFWDPNGTDYPARPRSIQRVKDLLNATAKVPGAQMLLIGDCTLKRQVPLAESAAWAWTVGKLVTGWTCPSIGTCAPEEPVIPYANVAIETHNEFENCRGRSDWGGRREWCPGKQDVAEHIRIYRGMGIANVTADDVLCWGRDETKTYAFRLTNTGATIADFHPCRSDSNGPWDPSLHFLQQTSEFNGGRFVLSETVAWGDDTGRCDGLSTCDQERIQSYVDRCAQVEGCHFTYHTRRLLAGEPPTWWPEAR